MTVRELNETINRDRCDFQIVYNGSQHGILHPCDVDIFGDYVIDYIDYDEDYKAINAHIKVTPVTKK